MEQSKPAHGHEIAGKDSAAKNQCSLAAKTTRMAASEVLPGRAGITLRQRDGNALRALQVKLQMHAIRVVFAASETLVLRRAIFSSDFMTVCRFALFHG